MTATAAYTDGYWQSGDGLTLHYRDYPGDPGRTPLLCVPGLTRNARDFAGLAERQGGRRRVIVVELRGRGLSDCAKDALTYQPPVYVDDLRRLFEATGVARVAMIGTSLGGILAMLLATTMRERLAAVLLNDVGPVLEADGLARIRSYVGRQVAWPSWLHAGRALREVHGAAHPGFTLEAWVAMAKRLCRTSPKGRIVPDYDLRIAEPFKLPPADGVADAPADPWPAFAALAGMPVALVRGARSDILSAETAAEMARRLPGLDVTVLADVGHAPTLDEPGSVDALDRLLRRVDLR